LVDAGVAIIMADGAGDGAGAGAAVGAASVVKVARDYTKHKDGVEWAVSGVLGTLFEKESYAHRFAGKRVLELGSGLGHLALRLAALGGYVSGSTLDLVC
jgi:2-polyprenyl-3-methyl-5-hydroxy-6-metoxy-1,4-benzoquinol methylase